MEMEQSLSANEHPTDWRRHPLFAAALAAMGGTGLARYCGGWTGSGWILGLVLVLLWIVVRAFKLPARHLLVWLCLAALFAVWTDRRWNLFPEDELGLRAPETRLPVVLDAELLTAPRVTHVSDPWAPGLTVFSQCMVRVLQVRDGRQWRPASGTARLTISGELLQLWRAGDHVRLYARWRRHLPAANPGEFPRANYFRQRRQLFELFCADESQLQLLQQAPWWSLCRWVEATRLAACQQLERYIDREWYPLAAALILGARHLLDWQMLEPFLQTGTVHLLAISGLHLAMVVYGIFALMRVHVLGFRTALAAACALVVLYAVLTSGQPPVVRAAILAIGVCTARLMGRPYSVWNLWGAAAIALLIYNPLQLFDAGVQLSFLAVAALLACPAAPWQRRTDRISQWLRATRPGWWRATVWLGERIAAAFWSSLIVWLVTLPLVVYRFQRASPIAVVANPFLWLPVALALLSGIGVIVTGAWCPWLAIFLGAVCSRLLAITYHGITWTENATGAHLWLASPPGFCVAWIYGAYLVWLISRRIAKRVAVVAGWTGALAGVWLVLVTPYWFPPQREALRLTFFAVGHGTCVLIELPCGRTLLYDAGRFGSPRPAVQYVSRTLLERRVRHLDLVFLSHTDADHFNALPGILERVRARDLALAQSLEEARDRLARQLCEELARQHQPRRLLAAGEVLQFEDGVQLSVLHPPAGYRAESDNAASLVVCLRYAGRTIVLPGDLEGSGMQRLLQQPALKVDVAMSPHHASIHSNHRAWTHWINARHVIISDSGPLPAQTQRAYEEARSRIWFTDQLGAIEVRVEPNGTLHIKGFRQKEAFVEQSKGSPIFHRKPAMVR